MKAFEVIEVIAAYHPPIDLTRSVDGLVIGDAQTEVTGIAVTLQPTPEVIRSAGAQGCNFLMCHEPTWFNGLDTTAWFDGDPVYAAKRQLIEQSGICIFRNHDRMHAHQPDAIYFGVAAELGWELEPLTVEGSKQYAVRLQTPQTAREIAAYLSETIGLNGIRLIGDADTIVHQIRLVSHMSFLSQQSDLLAAREADLVIPGEILDFSALSYVREACMLGVPKAVLNIGHYNKERLGMRHAARWLRTLVPQLPVVAIDSGDPYTYL